MAVFTIPAPGGENNSNYLIEVDLDGVSFVLSLRYNGRMGSWVIDLLNSNGEIIRSGVSMVSELPLFLRVVDIGRPAGPVMVLNIADKEINAADLDQFGGDALLMYSGET